MVRLPAATKPYSCFQFTLYWGSVALARLKTKLFTAKNLIQLFFVEIRLSVHTTVVRQYFAATPVIQVFFFSENDKQADLLSDCKQNFDNRKEVVEGET